ncbi:Piso0_000757 [Millerozyma farinosa CBS 7064]|uniref:Piso0_000757 protein n=1 Tax=Pichia sorbitophila (strain ATCC MYA-4447 / BCRC 22081 / CBS 7064 / NBRC 10061 / NRRL Y-12695) TaxID=559304 RepID=G8YRF5_PICSO|nr:Piso0_000757 [Millerozyma farinosa CBS 7064]
MFGSRKRTLSEDDNTSGNGKSSRFSLFGIFNVFKSKKDGSDKKSQETGVDGAASELQLIEREKLVNDFSSSKKRRLSQIEPLSSGNVPRTTTLNHNVGVYQNCYDLIKKKNEELGYDLERRLSTAYEQELEQDGGNDEEDKPVNYRSYSTYPSTSDNLYDSPNLDSKIDNTKGRLRQISQEDGDVNSQRYTTPDKEDSPTTNVTGYLSSIKENRRKMLGTDIFESAESVPRDVVSQEIESVGPGLQYEEDYGILPADDAELGSLNNYAVNDEGHPIVIEHEYAPIYTDDDGSLVRPPFINLDPRERYHLLQLKKSIETSEALERRIKYMVNPQETDSRNVKGTNKVETSTQTHDMEYLDNALQFNRFRKRLRQEKDNQRRKRAKNSSGYFIGEFDYDETEIRPPEKTKYSGYLGGINKPKFQTKDNAETDRRTKMTKDRVGLDESLLRNEKINVKVDENFSKDVEKKLRGSEEGAIPGANGPSIGGISKGTEERKPTLSFGNATANDTESDLVDRKRSKRALNSDTTDEKPSLNFGGATKTSSFTSGEKKEEKPTFSFGEKKANKPAFTFGEKKEDKPALTFGQRKEEKPAFTFGEKKEDKPAFSFGEKKEDKPAFSFGEKKDDKPAFTFDEKKEDKPTLTFDEKKEDKPAFTFGEKKQDKPAFTFGEKKEDKPSFTFGEKKEDKPSFTFGEKKEDKPAFTFGEKKEDKPTLTFGEKKEDKPAFTVGEKKEAKPAFTFEKKEDGKKDEKPAFTFGEKKDDKPTFKFGGFSPQNQALSQTPTQSSTTRDISAPAPLASGVTTSIPGTGNTGIFGQQQTQNTSAPPAKTSPFTFGAPSSSLPQNNAFGNPSGGARTSPFSFGPSAAPGTAAGAPAFNNRGSTPTPGAAAAPFASATPPAFAFTGALSKEPTPDPASIFGQAAPAAPQGQQVPIASPMPSMGMGMGMNSPMGTGAPSTTPLLKTNRKIAQMRSRRR